MARIKVLWRNQFLSIFLKSSYVKCGLKYFRFLSNIKIEKIEIFDFLKNLQKNVKWILSHSIGIMTKYNWWTPMRIKIMTITLLLKILEKIEFLEIGPFRKMAKTIFSSKDFLHYFSSYKNLIFQKEMKSFKT